MVAVVRVKAQNVTFRNSLKFGFVEPIPKSNKIIYFTSCTDMPSLHLFGLKKYLIIHNLVLVQLHVNQLANECFSSEVNLAKLVK